jgi:hypothetical protein
MAEKWRKNGTKKLAGKWRKIGGKKLAGKNWREKIGGKKLAGKFKLTCFRRHPS